jgi:hypothetical protein
MSSLTGQQSDIVDAASTGEDVRVRALAGTGKTFTLTAVARARPGVEMSYVGFNRAIVEEGRRKFPRNVQCNTAHAIARRAVAASRPELLQRLNTTERVPSWKVAEILRIWQPFEFSGFKLRERKLGGLVKETVKRFCSSTATEPQAWMVPKVPGLDTPAARAALSEHLMPFVVKAWEDLISDRGRLQFSHDVYLKLFSMASVCIVPGEVILFDEAQDADPVILEIIRRQQAERGVQVIPVGDENQQIYKWRGAVDSLEMFECEHDLTLTESFRFGPAIAEEANLILSLLPTDLRVVGHEPVASVLGELTDPDVVLCRTNAEAIARMMIAQIAGRSAGLVGGTSAVEGLARAAKDLSEGRETYHPELQAFATWNDVVQYVEEDADARDLQVLVRLVERYGPDELLDAVERAVPEQSADLVLSTMHKAKGREWGRVLLANDFPPPLDVNGDVSDEELRLAYVAATRAKDVLDSRSLGWLDSVARRNGVQRSILPAEEVPARASERIVVREVCNVMIDPHKENRVIMTGTRYNPELVEAQKMLPYDDPRERYANEYAGFERVRIVLATYKVLQVAERFGLTVSAEARERIEQFS